MNGYGVQKWRNRAQAQPDDLDLHIGRPIAFHLENPKMISKELREFRDQRPHYHALTARVTGVKSHRKFGKGSSNRPELHRQTVVAVLSLADAKRTAALQPTFELFKVIVQDQLQTPSASERDRNTA